MGYVDEAEGLGGLQVFSSSVLRDELARVNGVIDGAVMTGVDLSCWFERQRVIELILTSRAPS